MRREDGVPCKTPSARPTGIRQSCSDPYLDPCTSALPRWPRESTVAEAHFRRYERYIGTTEPTTSRARRSTRALVSHLVAATILFSGLRRSDRANTWCHARCGASQMSAAGGSSSNAPAPPATPTRTVRHVRRASELDGATPQQRPAQALRRAIPLDFGDVNTSGGAGLGALDRNQDAIPAGATILKSYEYKGSKQNMGANMILLTRDAYG